MVSFKTQEKTCSFTMNVIGDCGCHHSQWNNSASTFCLTPFVLQSRKNHDTTGGLVVNNPNFHYWVNYPFRPWPVKQKNSFRSRPPLQAYHIYDYYQPQAESLVIQDAHCLFNETPFLTQVLTPSGNGVPHLHSIYKALGDAEVTGLWWRVSPPTS